MTFGGFDRYSCRFERLDFRGERLYFESEGDVGWGGFGGGEVKVLGEGVWSGMELLLVVFFISCFSFQSFAICQISAIFSLSCWMKNFFFKNLLIFVFSFVKLWIEINFLISWSFPSNSSNIQFISLFAFCRADIIKGKLPEISFVISLIFSSVLLGLYQFGLYK